MLRPEHRQFDSLDRLTAPSDRGTLPSGRQTRLLDEASDVEALMKSLMPEGISPAKQAVIERLIEMWVAKSELDVA
ncbi:MAG: hypothetical protein KME45_15675 [Stenomitos rutilans HA7619-LM2]|jgi:hypothetical protein|nr:hypothetical protein [Stenomitos rutilans HA7619-LM2]